MYKISIFNTFDRCSLYLSNAYSVPIYFNRTLTKLYYYNNISISIQLDASSEMIGCSAASRCPNGEWFHLRCVGLAEEDIPDGDWWCSDVCEQDASTASVGSQEDHVQSYSRAVAWQGLFHRCRTRKRWRHDKCSVAAVDCRLMEQKPLQISYTGSSHCNR